MWTPLIGWSMSQVSVPGECSQWELWFPDYPIPLGLNQSAVLPVLVMTLA